MKKKTKNNSFSSIWSKLKYSPMVLAVLSIVWFLIRVIPKPGRVFYPCQRANLSYLISYISWFFSGAVLAGIIKFWRRCVLLIKNNFSKIVSISFIIVISISSYLICQDYKHQQFRQKWSRKIAKADINIKGISTSNSVVSLSHNPDATYGSNSPYDSDNNPAYSLVWKTVENLNLGSHASPLDELIDPGDIVLIKINVVDYSPVSHTHPAAVRPIIDMAIAAGATHIQIADGASWHWDTNDNLIKTGYNSFVGQLQNIYPEINIELLNLNNTAHWRWVYLGDKSSFAGSGYTDADLADANDNHMAGSKYFKTPDAYGANPNGQCLGWYAVSTHILNADVVINMPKLKIHPGMIMTAAIKNHVGSLIASTYNHNQWIGGPRITHVGMDTNINEQTFDNDFFWRAILDTNKIILYGDRQGNLQSTKQRKYLNILDAIQAAEKAHTGNSIVINDRGVILASLDPLALDAVAARIMGYNFNAIPSVKKVSQEVFYSIGINNPENVVIIGDNIDNKFNHVFIYNDNWKNLAGNAGLAISDFNPPQIINAQIQDSNNFKTINAEISNALVAFVKFTYNDQNNIQKMIKTGNQYSINIPLNTADIKIIAQDIFFNSVTWQTPLSQPTITLTKTADKSQVQPGTEITYTIHYHNTSQTTAYNVIITDNIPANTTYLSGGLISGNTVTWDLGHVGAGQQGDVELRVRVE